MPEAKRDYLAGYQRSLMDLNNRIDDFVKAKQALDLKKKQEAEDAKAKVINPFMEADNDGE